MALTMLLQAMTLLSPIDTPGNIVELAPIHTLFPIFIGAQIVSLGRLSGEAGCVTVVNTTFGPIAVLLPMLICPASKKTQFAFIKTLPSKVTFPCSK